MTVKATIRELLRCALPRCRRKNKVRQSFHKIDYDIEIRINNKMLCYKFQIYQRGLFYTTILFMSMKSFKQLGKTNSCIVLCILWCISTGAYISQWLLVIYFESFFNILQFALFIVCFKNKTKTTYEIRSFICLGCAITHFSGCESILKSHLGSLE